MVIAANFRKPNCFFFHYNSVTIWKKGTFSEIIYFEIFRHVLFQEIKCRIYHQKRIAQKLMSFLSNSIESLNLNASYT